MKHDLQATLHGELQIELRGQALLRVHGNLILALALFGRHGLTSPLESVPILGGDYAPVRPARGVFLPPGMSQKARLQAYVEMDFSHPARRGSMLP